VAASLRNSWLTTGPIGREFEAAFAQRRKEYDLLGRIDVMLNELARVKDHIVAQKKTLKAGDANASKLQAEIDGIDVQVATLTSSPANFEDFIQKPGEIREDVMSLMNQEPLAQASLTLYARLEREYALKAVAYNAWRSKIAQVNDTLKAAGCKVVAAPIAAATKPTALSPIATK